MKSKSSGYNIRVDRNQENKIVAKTNLNDDWETFQVFYFPDHTEGHNEMLVGLKSLANGNYLSSQQDSDLRANSVDCGETERFILHQGPKNSIGLQAKSSKKFLSTHAGNNEPLAFDGNIFSDLTAFEIEKLYDKSNFPKV